MSHVKLEEAIEKASRDKLNERLASVRKDWEMMYPTEGKVVHRAGLPCERAREHNYRDTADREGSTIVTNCFGHVFSDTMLHTSGHYGVKDMVVDYIEILMLAFRIGETNGRRVQPEQAKKLHLEVISQGIIANMMKHHEANEQEQKSVTIKGNFTVEEDVDCTESCSLNEGECPHGMECEGHDDE